MPRVFFITGTSTGFGSHLVQEVIHRGDIAVATARKPEALKFKGTNDKNYLPLKLDVTSSADIASSFKSAVDKFGRIDVVVNNAGYGLAGVFEELTDQQIKTQMDVNFFGLMAVTKKAMETMREQKPSGGVIQNVTSIGGQRGVPTFSIYCASKWAVEGFTESISKEVKPEWGIKFTCIEPGGFRTDWAGRSMEFPEKRHPAYDHLDAKKAMGKRHGTQVGDPIKGSKAMYELAIMDDPPLRIVLGSDAYNAINEKIKLYSENYKKYEDISTSTDVDESENGATVAIMASAVGANELTANELFEISQYEKIVTFHNTILAGIHATIGISGKECKLMKAINSVHRDKTRIKTAQGLLNENLRRKDDDGRFALEGSVPVPRSTLKVQSQNQRPSVQCSAREDVVAPSAARKSFYGVKGKSIPSGPRAEQGKAAPKAMYNPKPGLSSRSGPPRFAPTGPKVLARWPAQHVPPREDSIKTPLALAAFVEKENIIPHSAKGLKKKLGEAQEALSIPSDEKVRQIYNEGRAASIPVADQEFLGPPDTKAVAKMQATRLSSSDPLDDTDPKLVVGKLAAEPSSPKDSKLDNDRSPAHQKLLPTKPIRAHSARGSLQSNGSKGPRIRHLSNGDIIMNGTLFKRTTSPRRVRDKKTSGRKGRKRKRETEQVDNGRKAKDSGLLLHKRKKR